MFIGIDDKGENVQLDSSDFLTHGVILGRTGSGKTGLTVALLEEIAAAGSSAIVFDPKGDLTNMALSLSKVRDYEDWTEPGVDADETFLERSKDLADFGLSHDSVAIWKNKVKVVIYAPGKTYGGGRSINVFPTFDVPHDGNVPRRERASSEVGSVLEAVGHSSDPYDPALVFLTEAVLLSWGRNRPLPIDYWPGMLCAPPEQLQEFGGMSLDEFLPKRSRTKLARKLIGFRHQADRWLNGERFDLEKFAQGGPKLAVFTLRHLDEEERHFFTGLFMNKLVDFMFETSASQRLKLLVVLDEARGYLPPYPHNPPTKQPICTILAQGRAQGIGMLIGTQNPMDLDYKALSNVGTWFIGKLRERDCNRDLASELKSRAVDISEVENMKQRSFLLLTRRGDHHKFRVRTTLNYLRGPIGANDLLRLNQKSSPPPVAKLIKVSPAQRDNPETRPARRKFWGRIFGWGNK